MLLDYPSGGSVGGYLSVFGELGERWFGNCRGDIEEGGRGRERRDGEGSEGRVEVG